MVKIKRPKKPTRCYLCEKPLADPTTDHIIPRQLFDPKNPPQNLFTLPACRACNKNLSEDEELFRVFVLMQCHGHPQAQPLWEDKVRRSLAESPDFRKMLASQIQPAPLPAPFFSPDGKYIGDGSLFKVKRQRLEPVVKKIVRGLFYRHTEKFLGPSRFVIGHFDPYLTHTKEQVLLDMWEGAPRVDTGGNVLTYWYRMAEEDNRHSFWWLLFFGRVLFIVSTEPKTP